MAANEFHTIGKNEIAELEAQTNLTLYPYVFGGELARVRQRFSALNKNKYYLLLNMLVYGFDNKVLESAIIGDAKHVIDKGFVEDFLKMTKDPLLKDILAKTPAYQKGSFDDFGKFGAIEANTNNLDMNPMTGPKFFESAYITDLMNRINAKNMATIEGFANQLRTSAYLALPKRAYASLVALARAINGVIAAFNKFIQDIYNGIMHYVRQAFAIINGIIAKIMQLIQMFLESIIPIDILCILLLIFQQMVGDIPFFTSLMNMSGLMANLESTLVGYISDVTGFDIASFVSNPFGTISQFFPPQVNQIIGMINSFANNPDAFLSNLLMNYGYAMAAQSSQGQVWTQLLNQYGPSFVQMNPIGAILGSDQSSAGNSYTPPTPVSMGVDTTRNGTADTYGKPLDSSKINSNEPK